MTQERERLGDENPRYRLKALAFPVQEGSKTISYNANRVQWNRHGHLRPHIPLRTKNDHMSSDSFNRALTLKSDCVGDIKQFRRDANTGLLAQALHTGPVTSVKCGWDVQFIQATHYHAVLCGGGCGLRVGSNMCLLSAVFRSDFCRFTRWVV